MADAPVLGAQHQLAEFAFADADQGLVVATFEISASSDARPRGMFQAASSLTPMRLQRAFTFWDMERSSARRFRQPT